MDDLPLITSFLAVFQISVISGQWGVGDDNERLYAMETRLLHRYLGSVGFHYPQS